MKFNPPFSPSIRFDHHPVHFWFQPKFWSNGSPSGVPAGWGGGFRPGKFRWTNFVTRNPHQIFPDRFKETHQKFSREICPAKNLRCLRRHFLYFSTYFLMGGGTAFFEPWWGGGDALCTCFAFRFHPRCLPPASPPMRKPASQPSGRPRSSTRPLSRSTPGGGSFAFGNHTYTYPSPSPRGRGDRTFLHHDFFAAEKHW